MTEVIWIFWTVPIVNLSGGAPPLTRAPTEFKPRTHSPEIRAEVAMEAISGHQNLREMGADGAERMIQVSQWKEQLRDCAS